jgi:hypothetical protein
MKSASPEEMKEITAGVNNWEGNLMSAQAELINIVGSLEAN